MVHQLNLSKARLEADRQRVSRDIDYLENQLRVAVDPDIDEGDPGLTVQNVTIALLKNARQKAAAIERALTQAQSGTYGICEACEQPINPERLEIFPQATLCVPCKTEQEDPTRPQKLKAA